MTCREFTEFLIDYVENDLAAGERTTFDDHLKGCPDCVTYLRGYEQTIRLGKTVCKEDHDAVDDAVPEELVQAILAARTRRS
jgi:anti-sigma factor RsiW